MVALITGASGGIGADLALVFARHGHDLALVARRADKLHHLAEELTQAGRPRPIVIPCDLTARDAIDKVALALTAADARVAYLVNNAGFGLIGRAADLDAHEQLAMTDLNIRALVDLTLRFLPDLRAARGKILNVGSIGSFMPGPGIAVYYATKAFVSGFSRALSEEMKADGVGVSVLHPGLTATGFHERAGLGPRPGAGRPRGATSLSVAEAGYAGLMAGRRTIVPGLGNKLAAVMLPLIPDGLLLPAMHRYQRARR